MAEDHEIAIWKDPGELRERWLARCTCGGKWSKEFPAVVADDWLSVWIDDPTPENDKARNCYMMQNFWHRVITHVIAKHFNAAKGEGDGRGNTADHS